MTHLLEPPWIKQSKVIHLGRGQFSLETSGLSVFHHTSDCFAKKADKLFNATSEWKCLSVIDADLMCQMYKSNIQRLLVPGLSLIGSQSAGTPSGKLFLVLMCLSA